MNKLHPGALWQFRIRGLVMALFLLVFAIAGIIKAGSNLDRISAGVIVVFAILVLLFTEIYARLAYNNWSYEFTDTNLKIESGIIWKRYSNIPYERVQNVDITRGIWARMLGYSSINIQTAGYSYSPNNKGWSEGYLPAIDMNQAEKIRDFLIKKITKKSGGL